MLDFRPEFRLADRVSSLGRRRASGVWRLLFDGDFCEWRPGWESSRRSRRVQRSDDIMRPCAASAESWKERTRARQNLDLRRLMVVVHRSL